MGALTELLEFGENPAWLNLLLFSVAAVVVWFIGTRLSRDADTIADHTGLGKAFVGVVLLAGATSLPELAISVTAATQGAAQLATSNLLGGAAMQTGVLALADASFGKGALTAFTPRQVLLLQGSLLTLLLIFALTGMALAEPLSFIQIGLTSVLILVTYLAGMYLIHQYEGNPRWQPVDGVQDPESSRTTQDKAQEATPEAKPQSHRDQDGEDQGRDRDQDGEDETSTPWLFGRFALGGAVILVAGWVLSQTGEALAAQTGLGGTFIGATLVAISSSLPEVSTTLSAVGRGSYSLAISNIFGSNLLVVALLPIADAFYRDGPILAEATDATIFAAALASALTCIYIWGLVERRDRTILRMGVDSLAVALLYPLGLVAIYLLR